MATELNDKIEYIKNAKVDIKQALYNKTGESQSDDIRDYANVIDNIEVGIDTSDANATASDILNGKTAYVDGQKLTGTYTPSVDLNIYTQILEPQEKNGLWLKSNVNPTNIITDDLNTSPNWDLVKTAELQSIPYSCYMRSCNKDRFIYIFIWKT